MTMGSTGSRPRLRKVTPYHGEQEAEAELRPQWTLPALPITAEQSSGNLGHRKTTLPPLKQEVTLSTLSGHIPSMQSSSSSIIHAHPPRRPQALQPLVHQIGSTSTASQTFMGRDCKDGVVPRFSTIAQTGQSGTGRMTQGGFLEAQTALAQQAHRHRRAHLRQAREQRRHKVVYTSHVTDPNNKGLQRLKLVKRPTERNIFFDETTGEILDPTCLLDPESPRHLSEERKWKQPDSWPLCRGEERIQTVEAQSQPQQTGITLSSDKRPSWTVKRETGRVEERSDGWLWPELDSNCQVRRTREARRIRDFKLD